MYIRIYLSLFLSLTLSGLVNSSHQSYWPSKPVVFADDSKFIQIESATKVDTNDIELPSKVSNVKFNSLVEHVSPKTVTNLANLLNNFEHVPAKQLTPNTDYNKPFKYKPHKLPKPWWEKYHFTHRKRQPSTSIRQPSASIQHLNFIMPPEHIKIRQERSRPLSSTSRTSDSSPSLMRSLLGVTPVREIGSAQFECTFTPACWMQGGTPQPGCGSLLYSCCVMPASISRKDSSNFAGSGRGFGGFPSPLENEIIQNEPECGIANQHGFSNRIIGGHRAKFAELPWQVHIRISSYQCGGVLLNNMYVATAAHCVHQAKLEQITVHLGEYDTKDTEKVEEPLESESFKVEHITLHPEFRYMLTQPDRYDIALLKLDHPVIYRQNIIPICLPPMDYPLEGKIGVVAGWGKTDNSFGKTGTNLLNKVLVPIISNRRCRHWHKDKSISVQLHDEMFCAGHIEGRRDACLGDSGGPLVINFDGRWTLIGITSAGFGCAVEKQPGIYHKVGKTANWIAKHIQRP